MTERYALRLVSSASAAVSSVWDVGDDDPQESDDEYLRRLGVTIERVRKRHLKVTQPTLAKLVHREKNTISRWENGKTSLSAFDLSQIYPALGVPGDWLLNPTDSLRDLDRRIEGLRGQQLAEAAVEAAQKIEAERRRPRGGGGGASRRGKRSA